MGIAPGNSRQTVCSDGRSREILQQSSIYLCCIPSCLIQDEHTPTTTKFKHMANWDRLAPKIPGHLDVSIMKFSCFSTNGQDVNARTDTMEKDKG